VRISQVRVTASAKSRDLVGHGSAGGEASLPGFQGDPAWGAGNPLVSLFPKRSVENALVTRKGELYTNFSLFTCHIVDIIQAPT
jgi:hypothetical protein